MHFDRLLAFIQTRGDYYVIDVLGDGIAQKVGPGQADACQMYAKFSPSGLLVGWVLHNNLWVQDLSSGAVAQLTADGLPGHGGMSPVINGNFGALDLLVLSIALAAWGFRGPFQAQCCDFFEKPGADWAHEEELSLKDGWRWSPDSSRIAYWQLHTAAVQVFDIIDNTTEAP